jgi:hypothetical protein
VFENFFLLAVATLLIYFYSHEKDNFLKFVWFFGALTFITYSFFANFVPTTQTESHAAYNITTSNVPLNCVETGTLVLGAPVVQCGTTTEITQYPAYNVTTTFAPNDTLTPFGLAFGLGIYLGVIIYFIYSVLRRVIFG